MSDFEKMGIVGVDYANLSAVLAAMVSADPASVTTLATLQALVTAVPPPIPVSVMGHPTWWLMLIMLMFMVLIAYRRKEIDF